MRGSSLSCGRRGPLSVITILSSPMTTRFTIIHVSHPPYSGLWELAYEDRQGGCYNVYRVKILLSNLESRIPPNDLFRDLSSTDP